VHESIAAEFFDKLKRATQERLRVGDPLDEETNFGPCISLEQRDKIYRMLELAGKEGCEALVSGEYRMSEELRDGYYIHPHIYHTPTHASLWKDEVFGPVLAVSTFKTDDEAIQKANDTEYGLANAVMGANPARLARYRRELRSGVVWQNCSQPLYPSTPFGGVKRSGIGREYGKLGLEEFICHKTSIEAEHGYSWSWYLRK
jgi:betaine-aldehyde dehydrogenase